MQRSGTPVGVEASLPWNNRRGSIPRYARNNSGVKAINLGLCPVLSRPRPAFVRESDSPLGPESPQLQLRQQVAVEEPEPGA